MIQPIYAFSPRAGFRGSQKSHGNGTAQEKTKSEVAIINAIGTSVLAGGLTTAVARSYTSSWSHAGVLGACGSVLSMFFIAPLLVEKTSLLKLKKCKPEETSQSVSASVTTKNLKPVKKLVQFKQS